LTWSRRDTAQVRVAVEGAAIPRWTRRSPHHGPPVRG
jgi:hypothetical protein